MLRYLLKVRAAGIWSENNFSIITLKEPVRCIKYRTKLSNNIRTVFSIHLAISLFFGVGFFIAMLNGLKFNTALRILLDMVDLVLISTERQLRVDVIKRGSL